MEGFFNMGFLAATLVSCAALASGVSIPRSHAKREVSQLREDYDFVVVGGGTSGLTVADRLTEAFPASTSPDMMALLLCSSPSSLAQRMFLSSSTEMSSTLPAPSIRRRTGSRPSLMPRPPGTSFPCPTQTWQTRLRSCGRAKWWAEAVP